MFSILGWLHPLNTFEFEKSPQKNIQLMHRKLKSHSRLTHQVFFKLEMAGADEDEDFIDDLQIYRLE